MTLIPAPGASKAFHITTAGTYVLSTVPTVLRSVVLNTNTAGGTVTVYDNTAASGAVIAAITLGALVTLNDEYNAETNIGLTVVVSANNDITVVFD